MNISKAIRLALVPLCASMSALAGNAPTTPITNVIVLFQENVSFDHYFGTYPNAQNNASDQPFSAYPGTPTVNGYTPELLLNNPNKAAGSGANAGLQANPGRLSPSQAYTCSQNHNYGPEQQAVDGGLMDLFPKYTGRTTSEGCTNDGTTVLGYYDGNTVAALWNYAQNYSISDNSFGSTFGPSTPGCDQPGFRPDLRWNHSFRHRLHLLVPERGFAKSELGRADGHGSPRDGHRRLRPVPR